ncbi:MAG: hypothetical protein WC919_06010 [Candidatus Paceibacterota bacterium]|jgi:hypothetical protein
MQDIWPKFVECIQGMSFGVKYYRYDNATSKGVPFDTNNRQVVLSDNPLTRMLQEGKPFETPHPRCLWKVRLEEPRYNRPRQRPVCERFIMLD